MKPTLRPLQIVLILSSILIGCGAEQAAPKVKVVERLNAAPATQAAFQPSKAIWPQWRGPTRDASVKADRPWPDSLGGLRQLWHVDLGDGYSGPIVGEDKVFTFESTKGKEIVRALDRATGREIWTNIWEGSMSVPFFAGRNGSWVRSTPAYDGQSLFVCGMRDVMACIDVRTGKDRWRVDFVERYKTPVPSFGFVCSPLVTADAVYVQAGSSFVRLNKSTGAEVWRTLADKGGMNGSAFSSPAPATFGGREQLLVQTRKDLAGVDPTTGKVLWSKPIPAMQGMNILTPIAFADGVFTAAYGGSAGFFRVEGAGDSYKVDESWKLSIQGYMSTPVVINGFVYLQRRDQKLSCIDLGTGHETWTALPKWGEYASLVTDGRNILALAQTGELILVRHNPAIYEVLDRRKISEQETWAHVAVCGREIYVREQRGLTVFSWDESATKTISPGE